MRLHMKRLHTDIQPGFKKCPNCGYDWENREHFLNDAENPPNPLFQRGSKTLPTISIMSLSTHYSSKRYCSPPLKKGVGGIFAGVSNIIS